MALIGGKLSQSWNIHLRLRVLVWRQAHSLQFFNSMRFDHEQELLVKSFSRWFYQIWYKPVGDSDAFSKMNASWNFGDVTTAANHVRPWKTKQFSLRDKRGTLTGTVSPYHIRKRLFDNFSGCASSADIVTFYNPVNVKQKLKLHLGSKPSKTIGLSIRENNP